jgi:hypothetical protein
VQTSAYRNFKKANGANLPFNDVALISNFDEQVKSEYRVPLEAMTSFAERFLKEEKRKWLVRALLDLICVDKSVLETDEFYCQEDGRVVTKDDLITTTDFCLPALLLGIWHYIIVNRQKNIPGGKLDLDAIGKERGKMNISMPRFMPVDANGQSLDTDETEDVHGDSPADNSEPSVEPDKTSIDKEEAETSPQNQFLSQNGVFFQQFGGNSKQFFGDIENLTIN